MIASVAGTVLSTSPTAAVVEVGGVGLLVQCAPATLAGLTVGEPARLATTLVVRETELTLYGFADADEREVFETLQAAGGVGPKLAQAVLGVLAPDDVRRAVAEEDLAVLTKVPGIGRKGAQRIVLDLKDKLGPPSGGAAPRAGLGAAGSGRIMPAPRTSAEQVTDALVGLGYSAREAEEAVGVVAPADGPDGDVSALLRAALAVLRPR
ncbi:Holliday junction branch migration protein RuvA [Frankia sp. CNm7]|uniref:Holliday junction branch migration complex subunit RuvA n=1 Tax=Frankia nepalensis TaxID=1836974 RepID=A0A937RD77_9ACTN|nr:Holliday junction branch migration protein RuvA [Frankia nepalensis]MBL7494753.1 Holliday junction branch migration protein RuvA [Frankia nepalensis]MBL7514026.1 Holliday junction branch migration protein RuvA [Frankia nepalensis]MBL7524646.1 Holliday junction branch migration protein RuvA [Frankia nepalensis]MBL7629958.1 Holliday junction branch migration protein RuvA [Frankia nepalensis]